MEEPPKIQEPLRILVTGCSGYVAQFVVNQLANHCPRVTSICVTWSTQPWMPTLAAQPSNVESCQMDVTNAESVRATFLRFDPHAIVHCAALSSPGACEKDPAFALKVNCPEALVEAAQEHKCAIVYLSTDQVYGGTSPPYTELDTAEPPNEYAKSKLAFEHALEARWAPHSAVLRCSNIYGPLPPFQEIKGTKFLQWLEGRLRVCEKPIDLFQDEFRSFVSVGYVARACEYLVLRLTATPITTTEDTTSETINKGIEPMLVLNCGGSESLSRVDVAEKLLEAFDIPAMISDSAAGVGSNATSDVVSGVAKIFPTPKASVNMGYNSGLNITMDSSKLAALIGPDTPMLTQLRGE